MQRRLLLIGIALIGCASPDVDETLIRAARADYNRAIPGATREAHRFGAARACRSAVAVGRLHLLIA